MSSTLLSLRYAVSTSTAAAPAVVAAAAAAASPADDVDSAAHLAAARRKTPLRRSARGARASSRACSRCWSKTQSGWKIHLQQRGMPHWSRVRG